MIKVANIQIKVPLGQVNLPGKAMKNISFIFGSSSNRIRWEFCLMFRLQTKLVFDLLLIEIERGRVY